MSPVPSAYFDHNATTNLRGCARHAMDLAHDSTGNPSSIHTAGRAARKFVEDARMQIGLVFDVSPNQIIFTSGATEANNQIIKGFAGKRILIAATEHLSIIESAQVIAEVSNTDIQLIPVDEHGVINLSALADLLTAAPTALVSAMYVNNETGILQPVAEIAALAHKHGALFHCDAVQAVGRIPFTRASIDADFITITGHKFGGPLGAGAIIFKPQTNVPVHLHGGGHERRLRAGTLNYPAIAGFGAACAEAVNQISAFQKLSIFQDQIEQALVQNHYPVFGKSASRVSNTIAFAHDKKDSQTLMMAFDLNGICLSSGSACSSGAIKDSRVLTAMGVDPQYLRRNLRLSMGWTTTQKDVDLFLKIWDKIRV